MLKVVYSYTTAPSEDVLADYFVAASPLDVPSERCLLINGGLYRFTSVFLSKAFYSSAV